MTNCIAFLAKLAGKWEGSGINHEGQHYHGEAIFEAPVNNAAAIIRFKAAGTDGSIYHIETQIIGMDASGGFTACSASNNMPGIVVFSVAQPSLESIVLTLGDLANQSIFREVIKLHLEPDGSLFHAFAWAMPGEAMQDRSSASLFRTGA